MGGSYRKREGNKSKGSYSLTTENDVSFPLNWPICWMQFLSKSQQGFLVDKHEVFLKYTWKDTGPKIEQSWEKEEENGGNHSTQC